MKTSPILDCLRANQRARREARAAAARRGVTAVIRTRRLTGAAAWLALAARAPEMLARRP